MSRFLNIEKKFAWSFLGVIIALIFGIFTLYQAYFEKKDPSLELQIETNTKVLDIKENLYKLDIIYDGENIKLSGKNLSILRIRAINTSSVNILQSFYDEKDPVGIFVENGSIVEKPELIEASNDYLRSIINLKVDSIGKIMFPEVIIEGGEYFTIKILVLHLQDQVPRIGVVGKIAGIKNIEVVDYFETTTSEKDFWEILLSGGILVNILRFIFSILIVVISFFIAIGVTELIPKIRKRNRRRIVTKYKLLNGIKKRKDAQILFSNYIENGKDELKELSVMLSNKETLEKILREEILSKPYLNEIKRYDYDFYQKNMRFRFYSPFNLLYQLVNINIIKYENSKVEIDDNFIKLLSDFLNFV